MPAAPSTPQPNQSWQGPVGYLQSGGPLISTGAITHGTRQAIVAVMSGDTASGTSFSPDNLTVDTQGSSSPSSLRRSAGMRARRSLISQVVPVEAHPADDSALLQKLRGIAAPGARAQYSERRRESVVPSNPAVGSTASIWVEDGVGTNYSVQVPATLVVQTAHGNIWMDDTLRNTAAWSNAAQIGTDFENGYVSDTAHFAHPDYPDSAPGLQAQYQSCDSSGHVTGTGSGYITEPIDHRVDVMVVNSADLGGYGGYFSAANLMNQSALNCLGGSYESNEAPFIFVGWFQSQSSDYELREDMVRGTAHELQHLINFVNHALLPEGSSSPSFNGSESPFINEGLSMLAQDLAVQKMYGAQGVNFDADDALARADAYLSNPGNFSISTFAGVDSTEWGGGGSPRYNCFGGCYGGAYLFERYLHDRFGGDSYTHAIETSGSVGPQNLQNVTGESSSDLLDDFALAMAANALGVNRLRALRVRNAGPFGNVRRSVRRAEDARRSLRCGDFCRRIRERSGAARRIHVRFSGERSGLGRSADSNRSRLRRRLCTHRGPRRTLGPVNTLSHSPYIRPFFALAALLRLPQCCGIASVLAPCENKK